jgi:hypothetical protein
MVSAVEKKSLKSCIIHIPKHLEGIAMMKYDKAAKKISKVMGEYKAGKLHSGGTGKVVKNPKQAVAIAMSEAGKSKPMKKGK